MMKNGRVVGRWLGVVLACAILLPGGVARAATAYWDASGLGTSQGGSGIWDLSSTNWTAAQSDGLPLVWNNTGTQTANLGGTAGTLTVASGTTINVNNITFATTGYSINGADSSSILNLNGTTPTIAVGAGISAAINAVISGSNVTKTGTGTLTLGTGNQLGGGTFNIASFGGTVLVTNTAAVNGATNNGLGSNSVGLGTSSTLSLRNDGAGGTGTGVINFGNNISFGSTSTLTVGSVSGATVTNKTIALGTLTMSAGSGNRFTISSLNGYDVSFGAVTLATNPGTMANSANVTVGAVGQASANQVLSKGLGGTLTLTAAGTYSGGTIIYAGAVSVADLSYLGTGSVLHLGGRDPATSSGATGTLIYTGTGATSGLVIDLGTNLAASGFGTPGGKIQNDGSGALIFTSDVTATATGTDSNNTKTLTLQGSNTGNNTIAGKIGDSISTTTFTGTTVTSVAKAGTGNWILSGANSYTGSTSITGGVLSVGSVADGGVQKSGTTGAIGASTITVADTTGLMVGQAVSGTNIGAGAVITDITGTTVTLSVANTGAVNTAVSFGTANALGLSVNTAGNLVINGGTLQYTGGAASTNRLFQVGQTTAGGTATLDASGTGAINFSNTGNLTYGNANQTRNVVLTGTNTGANTLAASIGNNGSGAVSVTKSGAGTWVLSGTSTYTGATTVNNGTLLINGSLASGSAVALNTATLGGSGTVAGLVTTAGASSVISPGNSPGTLNLTGGLNAALGATLNFELGTGSDLLNLGSGVFTGSTAANGLVFNFSDSGGLVAGVAYTLIDYGSASGLDYADLLANVLPSGFILDTTFGNNGFLIDTATTSLQVQFAAVPEPETWALLLVGSGLLPWLSRKRGSARRNGQRFGVSFPDEARPFIG